jgi:hypothetical protein
MRQSKLPSAVGKKVGQNSQRCMPVLQSAGALPLSLAHLPVFLVQASQHGERTDSRELASSARGTRAPRSFSSRHQRRQR